MLSPEWVAATQRANLDIPFGLTDCLVEFAQKLTELNWQTIRSTLADTHEHALKSVSAKEAQEWLALHTSSAALIPVRAQTYGRQLFELMYTTQAEFARLAQAQFQRSDYRGQTGGQEAAESRPASSQDPLAAWVAASSALYETLQKTGQQAFEVAKSNFDAVNASAAQTARRAAEQASHAARRSRY